MTAWEALLLHSTLQSGTAWQHLQNQQGGGGGTTVLVVNDGIDCEVDEMELEALLDGDIEVELDEAIEAVLDDEEFIAELT